jgi:hypothetical protein
MRKRRDFLFRAGHAQDTYLKAAFERHGEVGDKGLVLPMKQELCDACDQ